MISKEVLTVNRSNSYECFAAMAGGSWFYYTSSDGRLLSMSCRESFFWYVAHSGGDNPRRTEYAACEYIGLSLGKYAVDIRKVALLWMRMEKILGIKPFSVFHRFQLDTGQKVGGFIVHINHWWMENSLRRSAMTLFLRGFVLYVRGDPSSAVRSRTVTGFLNHYPLANSVRLAVEAFLDGRTDLADKDNKNLYKELWNSEKTERGFVAIFFHKSRKEVEEMTVKCN